MKSVYSNWQRWKACGKAYRNLFLWPISLLERRRLFKRIVGLPILHLAQGKMLDVGTGPGDFVLLSVQAAPNIRCIGIDIDPILLDIARQRASKTKDHDRISFQQADVQALPFENESFDLVFCAMSIYQWPDHEKGVEEIYRVLKKNMSAILLVGRGWLFPLIKDSLGSLSERYLQDLFESAGFRNVTVSRPAWHVVQVIGKK